jgi:hypothetical protein
VIVHAYTLVHLVMLTDKAKRYHRALYEQIGDKGNLSKEQLAERKAKRDGLRRQLPSNIFIQFLIGPSELRESAFGWLLRAIGWITLVIGPIVLLLFMQIQFLPFHSSFVTWTQRLTLLVDLGLIWWLWRRVVSGRAKAKQRPVAKTAWAAVGLALSFCVLLFSWPIATFPGEWQENRLSALDRASRIVSFRNWIFKSPVDATTRRRRLPLSNTLVLTGLNLYEGLGIDDPEKAKWHDFVFRARGRDLRGAIFDLATLPKVDFEGADLGGASFKGAQLKDVSFKSAQLKDASLEDAHLERASFNGGHLRGANLSGAQLEEATLNVLRTEKTKNVHSFRVRPSAVLTSGT